LALLAGALQKAAAGPVVWSAFCVVKTVTPLRSAEPFTPGSTPNAAVDCRKEPARTSAETEAMPENLEREACI